MRNLIFSLMHNLGVSKILRKCRIKNKEITVLMFHRITDEYDPLWPPMPIKSFKRLLKELSTKVHIVPLENIEKIDRSPDKPLVALSFDDGYLDFWENAVPILIDFKLPAHHNICPNLIYKRVPPWTQILSRFLQCNTNETIQLPNKKIYRIGNKIKEGDYINICSELCTIDDELRNNWINSLVNKIPESQIPRLMNWDQIRECAKLGFHIGSHGMNHLNMSKIENKDTLLAEIKDSKRKIYQEIGIEPLIFAFPRGLYNSSSMEIVKKSGYKIALLCDDMVSIHTGNEKKNYYIFPRINISGANWKEENLRLLGFHQKLKSWIKKTPYIFQQPLL